MAMEIPPGVILHMSITISFCARAIRRPWSLEIGQIVFVLVVLVVIKLLSFKKNWSMILKQIPSYTIGSLAAFWLIERVVEFWS